MTGSCSCTFHNFILSMFPSGRLTEVERIEYFDRMMREERREMREMYTSIMNTMKDVKKQQEAAMKREEAIMRRLLSIDHRLRQLEDWSWREWIAGIRHAIHARPRIIEWSK